MKYTLLTLLITSAFTLNAAETTKEMTTSKDQAQKGTAVKTTVTAAMRTKNLVSRTIYKPTK